MTDTNDAKTRLTEIARKHFKDNRLEVDENFTPASYGMSLREMLENPKLGEKAVIDYWEFKQAGGYE